MITVAALKENEEITKMNEFCNVMLDTNELELLLRLIKNYCNADGSQMHIDLTNKLKCAYNVCSDKNEGGVPNASF